MSNIVYDEDSGMHATERKKERNPGKVMDGGDWFDLSICGTVRSKQALLGWVGLVPVGVVQHWCCRFSEQTTTSRVESRLGIAKLADGDGEFS
jgi:hypothetical protein